MEKNNETSPGMRIPEPDPGFKNIYKWLFLTAVLVGAWFLLDWLING